MSRIAETGFIIVLLKKIGYWILDIGYWILSGAIYNYILFNIAEMQPDLLPKPAELPKPGFIIVL